MVFFNIFKGGRTNVCGQDASCVFAKLGCGYLLSLVFLGSTGEIRSVTQTRFKLEVKALPSQEQIPQRTGGFLASTAESIAKVSTVDKAEQLLQHYSLSEN